MTGTTWNGRHHHCDHLRGTWGPLNIGAMVIGFIIYWPLGLAVLAYNIFAQPGDFSHWLDQAKDIFNQYRRRHDHDRSYGFTGNRAFDEYRTRMMRTLDEERQRLEQEVRAFREFQEELRRTQDREAFDRFMAEQKPRR